MTVAGLLGAAAFPAFAADQPVYAPVPDWVTPIPIPEPAPDDKAAVQLLLWTTQSRFAADGDETFQEVATRLASQEGLERAGNLIESWDPETETLTVNHVRILRGGQTIDVLAGGRKLTVVRRETKLESAMLDGRLTATLQVEGLRVGDVLDAAVTMKRKDPALAGRSEGGALAMHAGVARRIYIRELWPSAKMMRWKASEDLPRPVVRAAGLGSELVIDAKDHVTPEAPKGAPLRFVLRGYLQASEFKSWPEVSSVAAALWVKPMELKSDSPLMAEAARIRSGNPTPEGRAMAALRLVQDQVRYVYIGMNLGGYTPAAADLTWSRRFGDCKGKTALLLALLKALGIEAEPAMVNVEVGDGLDERLPMFESFDHVLVRATIGGRIYWLDGTRSGDRRLEDLPVPEYHWALPVVASGAGLERLTPRRPTAPLDERSATLDLRGGPDAPAPLEAEQFFREDAAAAFSLAARQLTAQDLDKALRKFWLERYAWATPASVDYSYDDTNRVARLSFKGTAKPPWSKSGRKRDLWLDDTALGWDTSYTRQAGPHRDAPYAVNHPSWGRSELKVLLPDQGATATFSNNEPVDERLAGVEFHRRSELKDGVASFEAWSRSFEPEFPAVEAAAAELKLRDISTHSVLLTLTLPRGAEAPPPPPDPSLMQAPADAEGFAYRAARFTARKEYEKAEADLDQAIRLKPDEAKFRYDRGVVRLRRDKPDAAMSDFDEAIRRKPEDALAHLARGQLRLAVRKQPAAAEEDFAAVMKTAETPETPMRIALAYREVGDYARQIDYLSRALKVAKAENRPALLNERCYARARWGRELDQALADCEAALAVYNASPAFLDSRALVRLRQKRYDLALADYDAALSRRPDNAASLYGRGLTKLKLGRTLEAAADLGAARAKDPTITDGFARDGLKP